MKNISKLKRIESTATIAAGLMILHYLLFIKQKNDNQILFFAALFVLLSGLFFKLLGNLISFLWEKLAEALGWFNSKVILSIVFFVVLTPFALLYRLFNRDSLFFKKRKSTYYTKRDHVYQGKDLENIW